jgi:nicotinate-nucleotide pyrophosphorylase (carboxylating)
MVDQVKIMDFIRNALKEDIGRMDLTTTFLIPSSAQTSADVIANSSGVVAGLPFFEILYSLLDRELRIKFNINEGAEVEQTKAVCYIEGQATSILKGERSALNLLSRASGIATLTKKFVDKVKPYNVEIYDTRKTTPNMRHIEKYAVRVGGGKNHRMGLYDQILIKDNHLAVLNGLKLKGKPKDSSIIVDSVKIAKKRAQKNVKVEIEVKNIAEFEEALSTDADIIMLDNMPPEEIKEAVKIRDAGSAKGRRVILEVSGNITLQNVEEYAKTGVDRISVGAITHSPEIIDFSLQVI